MSLENLKITHRIAIGFTAVLMLMTAAITVSDRQLSVMEDAGRHMSRTEWSRIEAVMGMQSAAGASAARTAALFGLADKAATGADTLNNEISGMRALLSSLQSVADSSDDAAAVARIEEALAAYAAALRKTENLLKQDSRDEAAKAMASEMAPALQALQKQLASLGAMQKKRVQAAADAAAKSSWETRLAAYGLGAAALIAAAGLGVWLASGIITPLQEAIYIAETVSSGDLSQEFNTERGGDFGRLLSSLGDMEDRLTDLVGKIKESSDSIMAASKQIASGNQDFSERNREQLASLVGTTATMQELTLNVKKNADSATRANELAVSTSTLASKGGGSVTQLVGTMNSISASSQRIVDIIGVIDGIAFQTNILALNASVEAARAGEQGRGFAVVAGEVRNLAQRAANAAREIKGLIDDSVEKVDEGSKRVAEAGATMQEIVASANRVTDIMAEISAASREQAADIEQINRSMAGMDDAARQNSSLVEDAAAAAASLQRQAGTLVEVVSSFKLDDEPASA
ncbi:methyl-accepting chemotaxis protein [Noviherbaspirillum aerium]|uniref:methyl-accepting chemotaxis protein n=1 Tax=Noviherbaspirillum aerium TaxID=2588497 RepID=UPI001CEFA290|nr:methyl-accepting chemotaxis protein [Noviherbaspirillum aerium]